MNILRRLPLTRLLLLCGAVLAAGASLTALALALGAGPTPPPKPLAQAVHDALGGGRVSGFSANIKLTDNLLEGANLPSGSGSGGSGAGGLASNPLLAGGQGRLWVSSSGRVRLELQAEKGDTQIIYDGTTVELYDASTNTLYRYTPAAQTTGGGTAQKDGSAAGAGHEPPSVPKIEEAIARIRKHAVLSGATPTDVGGQAAYTVRISPQETGSLIGGAELSFDASNGLPLRAAVYSADSAAPVIELAAGEVSYGPVSESVFDFKPPSDAKIVEVKPSEGSTTQKHSPSGAGAKPTLSSHGHGLATIGVLEEKTGAGKPAKAPEGLPTVQINGVSASELRTALGTVLSFERAGVTYVVAGAVPPKDVEALARGL